MKIGRNAMRILRNYLRLWINHKVPSLQIFVSINTNLSFLAEDDKAHEALKMAHSFLKLVRSNS